MTQKEVVQMKFMKDEKEVDVEPTVKIDLSAVFSRTEKDAALERANRVAGRILLASFWWLAGVISCWWLFQWANS